MSNKDSQIWENANGERHREDGPAVEWSDGHKEWYQNGKLHREDGPAIEFSDGRKEWYQNGKIHREGGPAVEWPNGSTSWFQNGKLHRIGGPAGNWGNYIEWWEEGIRQPEKSNITEMTKPVQNPVSEDNLSAKILRIRINKALKCLSGDLNYGNVAAAKRELKGNESKAIAVGETETAGGFSFTRVL